MSDQVVKRNCIDLCRSRFTQEVFGIFPEAESRSERRTTSRKWKLIDEAGRGKSSAG